MENFTKLAAQWWVKHHKRYDPLKVNLLAGRLCAYYEVTGKVCRNPQKVNRFFKEKLS